MMISQRSNWHFVAPARLLTPVLVLALTACGGGGSGANYFEPGGNGGSGTTGGDTTGGDTTVPDTVTIGAMIGGSFSQGEVDVSVDTLSAGGTAEVAVNLVNQNGDPVTTAHTISFSSRCTADGTATLETEIPTVNGQAVSEYVANGCVGDDEIRATVDVDGSTLTAIGTIIVEQENIGSLEFVGAEPPQIALAGTGGKETSRVTFRLVGQAGGAIQDATVDFTLNSQTGGLDLTADSGITNREGLVSTTVRAGSIATSVRVTATETSTGISTQSAQLVVSTGIPDSDSFSLSVSTHNPEAWEYDGEEVTVAVLAADAFNNPVPDGTAVSFYAEGGSVDPSCTTVAGGCTVIWRSQNPRPGDGLVTIMATAIGNESFVDADGDGRFDDGEAFADDGEAFANENDDSDYDVGEFFIDFGPNGSPNGSRDPADGKYNGVLCSADNSANFCSDDRSVIVWDEQVISMSSRLAQGFLRCSGTDYFPGETIAVASSETCTLFLFDINGNALPFETAVSIEATTGLTVGGSTNFAIGGGIFPSATSVVVGQQNSMTPASGSLTVTTTTPKNNVTALSWSVTP